MKNSYISPKIYVLLAVHNRFEYTSTFLDCLRAQSYEKFRLILVDDGSTDGTADYVRSRDPSAVIIRGSGQLWWAGAQKKCYEYLRNEDVSATDIVWIGNNDTEFEADYFDRLVSDPFLTDNSLVVSPGKSRETDWREYGFKVSWWPFRVHRALAPDQVNAVTTRGLYMRYATYSALGTFYPKLLPQYLSDIEYTYRANKRGHPLRVSSTTSVYVDRRSTGQHIDAAATFSELFHNHFMQRSTSYSTLYWGNFALLAAPWKYKIPAFVRVYVRFTVRCIRLLRQIRDGAPNEYRH